ncbi:MAG: glucosyltransferase domain-containing protein [Lachnospiraceae bacterium]|nr:glucosyltransferase domain-containing protein [Lachnospiraceae bacterium]
MYKKLDVHYKAAFLGALICGLCAHLYQFTNKIPNYDEYGQTPGGIGATLGLGRWGLELSARLYGFFFGWFSFPMVNGLFTLILIALSASILVAIFGIKDRVICILTGGICAVFPTVTSTYFFMFTAQYYGMALLCACLGAYVLVRSFSVTKYRIVYRLISVVMMSLATGIYQAYAAVFVTILLIDVIIRCYRDSDDAKKIAGRGVVYCLCITAGFILYMLITIAVNRIYGIELSDYHGMGNMGSISPGKLIYSLIRCYSAYLSLPLGKDILELNYSYSVKLIYGLAIFITVFVPLINLTDRNKRLGSRLLFVLGTMLIPPAVFLIFILSAFGDGAVYTLMVYPAVFILIYPLLLCDGFTDIPLLSGGRINAVISYISCISVCVCIVIYFWFANANYQGLQYTHYHDMAYFQTLMTQIKSLDGYNGDMPVAILGEFEDSTNNAGSLMGYHFNIGGKWETNINYKNRVMIWFCYLGFTPEVIEDRDRLQVIFDKPAVREMPLYPEAGSIAIVDDVVVIKAGDSIESDALY